jgi:hypothetical protein
MFYHQIATMYVKMLQVLYKVRCIENVICLQDRNQVVFVVGPLTRKDHKVKSIQQGVMEKLEIPGKSA